MSKLNPNAQKWVDALRSGRFMQTRHTLADDMGYCCLGVACEVAIENGIQLVKKKVSERHGYISFDGAENYLPAAVQQWLGLKTDTGLFDGERTLAYENDDHATFHQLANIIEDHAEELGVA